MVALEELSTSRLAVMAVEDLPTVDSISFSQREENISLLPGIIVLNYNYFPENVCGPAKVGATAFAMSAIQALRRFELFRGAILYKRQEGLNHPVITTEVRNSVLCATVSFNFGMEAESLRKAISTTAELLACHDVSPPMLYYQTDTLLEYHPEYLPLCVTHHGPFYEDFARHFSDKAAGTAFGSQEKATHLHIQQNLGIEQLKDRNNAFVLLHSQVQGRHLAKRGVDTAKMFQLCPPIYSMRVEDFSEITYKLLRTALNRPGLLLFTAVARLDYFKDVELLVDAALQLQQQNLPVTVLIAGDDEEETSRRKKLYDRIPGSHRRYFYIVPKLRKDMLYSLFEHCRHKGAFVCPSRYETLGITPLESALRGVTTLISDSSQVEARRFFPDRYCFQRTADDLAATVKFFEGKNLHHCGQELQKHLQKNISEENFMTDFLHAWQECSKWVVGSSQP